MLADIQFQIGNFVFNNEDSFVMPNGMQGGISDLGGIQAHELHEFQGGLRTVQLFGPFPTLVEFKGIFYGANALSRAKTLDLLRTNSEEVTMTYGAVTMDGVVTKMKITAMHQNEVHYELTFLPVVDNSSRTSGIVGSSPSATLSNAQNAANFQAQSPAANYTFPPSVQNGVSNLNQAYNQALSQAGGQIGNLTAPQVSNLQNQTQTVLNQLQPLITGADPLAASAASDLSSSLQTMSSTLTQDSAPLTTITVNNPNLFSLATQYYGDPMAWTLITDANPLLQGNPIPVGNYTLTIPQNDAPAPLVVPPTVLPSNVA